MMKLNNDWVLSLILIAFIVNILNPGHAAGQTESCVTAKCHAGIGKDKVVHIPVKEGMCTACHLAVEEKEKKTKHPGNLSISLMLQGADLCYSCHEPKNKKKVVHPPVSGGDCISCHNPHQSPNKAMLKESMPELCFQCHPEGMVKQQVMHAPAAAGDCSSCHDNHQSDFSHRLVADGNALCFTCHPDKEEGLKSKKHVHPPVKESCIVCHNPHGSAVKAMLRSAVPAVCSNCHPSEAALSQRALVKHGPMTDSKACLNCHEPHAADFPKLLQKTQRHLCLSCHDKEQATDQGTIMNMKAFLEANRNGHGPVKEGECAACHNPHGSDYWRILNRYYPPDFYTSYSEGKYALCFTCHRKSGFSELHTDSAATNFSDGRKNLHFVHVNKNGKGRTCRACHEVHADPGRPKHIKDWLQFSGWSMPLNYTPNKNGGACAPGCHGEKGYSRQR